MNATTTPYTIGDKVVCSDGDCGDLTRVIIDPVARTLTHLVVQPGQEPEASRLVPVALVNPDADYHGITLRCDTTTFANLETAEETEFLPAGSDELGYMAGQTSWLPYYPLGGGMAAATIGGADTIDAHGAPQPQLVSYERVPLGEVQIRRGEPVHAADGDIGQVRGLVVDPQDNQVTHVLLEEGHLWGKKEVAIPIGAVTGTADGLELNLTKDAIRDLPAVEIGHHDWQER
jgi:PRC-barrel domain